jgi:hypothetical protein
MTVWETEIRLPFWPPLPESQTHPVKLVMIGGNGEQSAAYELDLDKLMYIAHERQCQDHVRYQEHQGKPDNQFAVSLGSVHVSLTDFPTAVSDPGHTALQSIPRRSGCRLI